MLLSIEEQGDDRSLGLEQFSDSVQRRPGIVEMFEHIG
jgi:hypothetical protein